MLKVKCSLLLGGSRNIQKRNWLELMLVEKIIGLSTQMRDWLRSDLRVLLLDS